MLCPPIDRLGPPVPAAAPCRLPATIVDRRAGVPDCAGPARRPPLLLLSELQRRPLESGMRHWLRLLSMARHLRRGARRHRRGSECDRRLLLRYLRRRRTRRSRPDPRETRREVAAPLYDDWSELITWSGGDSGAIRADRSALFWFVADGCVRCLPG